LCDLAAFTAAATAALIVITAATGILDEDCLHGFFLLSIGFMRDKWNTSCVSSNNSNKPAFEVVYKWCSNSVQSEKIPSLPFFVGICACRIPAPSYMDL
jgi:hypothetical protein